jgi:hypothetical protein
MSILLIGLYLLLREQLVRKGQQVQPVLKVQQDHKVQQALLVQWDHKDYKERQVLQELKVRQVYQDQ